MIYEVLSEAVYIMTVLSLHLFIVESVACELINYDHLKT